jgi:hypothetical protein
LRQHVPFPVENAARFHRADHPFDIDDQDLLFGRAFHEHDFLHPALAQEIDPEGASRSEENQPGNPWPMLFHRSSIRRIPLYHIFFYAAMTAVG